MRHTGSVTVYSFRVFDPDTRTMEHMPYMAQRAVIASHLGAELLEGTALEVSVEELDRQGRFRRVATGWGELD